MDNFDLVSRMGMTPKELVSRVFNEPSGPGTKKYPGKVVNNNDPLQLGRCRIRIFDLFDGIPDKDLPWAIPEFTFVGSKVGNFAVPPNDSIVWVHFDNGESTSPIYTTKVVNTNFVSKNLDDYPNSVIHFEMDDGEFLRSNRATRETLYKHSSGTLFKIDATGNVTIDATGIINVNAPIIQTPSGVVSPTGSGALCCMAFDPLTGAPQVGNTLIRQGV